MYPITENFIEIWGANSVDKKKRLQKSEVSFLYNEEGDYYRINK